jgi:hypothetical protein
MNGRQSFLLNDIKNHIRQGGNVTHILYVKIANQPDNTIGNAIRLAIFRRICGIPITRRVNGMNVTITWRSAAVQTSAYYHADVQGMLGDTAVKLHSMSLLRNILTVIDAQFENIFTNGTTGVSFLVTKPLVREVVLGDEVVLIEDEELDDQEENF